MKKASPFSKDKLLKKNYKFSNFIVKSYFFKCKFYKKTGGSIMKYQTLFALILGVYLAIPYANAIPGNFDNEEPDYYRGATKASQGIVDSENARAEEEGRDSRATQSGSTDSRVNMKAEVDSRKRQWRACVRTCIADSPNQQDKHIRCESKPRCLALKKEYQDAQRIMDNTNAALKANADQAEDSEDAGVNTQLGNQKKRNSALAWVGAGTTAFLGYKTNACFSSCSFGACGGCFALAGLTATAGLQTIKMFDKSRGIGDTQEDISGNKDTADRFCVPNPVEDDPEFCQGDRLSFCMSLACSSSDTTTPPEAGQTPRVTAGGPGDSGTPGPMNPYQPGVDDSTTSLPPDFSTDAFIANLGKKFEPKGGWPAETGGNPFKKAAEDGFSYEKLSDEQKAEINKAMKGFNQRKKAFMAKHGLLNDKKSKDKLAKKEDIPQESFDVAADFSEIIEEASDPNGDTGNSRGRGRSSKSKKPPNTADKIQAMLMQMSRKPTSKKAPRSVVLKNEKVGVREDNIFLMVHRMNRRLDEEDKYFINDF